jgi:hypothetical protein
MSGFGVKADLVMTGLDFRFDPKATYNAVSRYGSLRGLLPKPIAKAGICLSSLSTF